MNKSIFTGRLTRDPELRYTPDGVAVLTIDIAVEDGYKDKKRTGYPTLVLWRQSAEYIAKYTRKGDMIEAVTRYTERKWEDREGKKRKSVEFVVDEVKILQSDHRAQDASYQDATSGHAFPAPPDYAELNDEDAGELPF